MESFKLLYIIFKKVVFIKCRKIYVQYVIFLYFYGWNQMDTNEESYFCSNAHDGLVTIMMLLI